MTEGLDQIRLWEAYCLDIVQTVSVPAYGILKPEGESDILQLPEQVHLIALEDCYSLMVEKLPIPWSVLHNIKIVASAVTSSHCGF